MGEAELSPVPIQDVIGFTALRLDQGIGQIGGIDPVSYTHLTLPTSDLV